MMAFMVVMVEAEFSVVKDLPSNLLEGIGQVIVLFSRLEFVLSKIIHDLLGISEKEGRLAVREPRASERVNIIADLLALRNMEVGTDLKKLQTLVENLEKDRNKVAHGIWVKHPKTGELLLRVTKGTWQDGIRGKVKRIIVPEAFEVSPNYLAQIAEQIDQTTIQVLSLAREIVNSTPTLHEKYHGQAQS